LEKVQADLLFEEFRIELTTYSRVYSVKKEVILDGVLREVMDIKCDRY